MRGRFTLLLSYVALSLCAPGTVRSIDAIYSARGSWARPFLQAQNECSPAYLIVLFTSNKLLFAAVLRATRPQPSLYAAGKKLFMT